MTNGHNSSANADIIKSVAGKMRDIQTKRKALSEQAAKQRERLKDAGVEKHAFGLVLRIADLEDEAARQNYMDSLAECWGTLGVGGSLDWITAIESEDAGEPDEPTAPEDA